MVHLTPTRGVLRLLRGVVLATTSASLSVAAHAAAGGALPDPGTTAVITVLLTGAGVALADRRRGSRVIVGALTISQLALHAFLQLVGSHQHQNGHAGLPFDPPMMLAGHLLAAVLTGLLLARAEHALFVAAKFLRMILPRKHTPLSQPTSLRTVCIPAEVVHATAEVLYRCIHPPRGPPPPLLRGSCQ